MTNQTHLPLSIVFENSDKVGSNPSANPTIGDVVAERLSRRDLMIGMLAVSSITAMFSPLALMATDQAHRQARNKTPSFNFEEVAAGSDAKNYLAEGYNADVLICWGDKVLKDAPEFDPQKQNLALSTLDAGDCHFVA